MANTMKGGNLPTSPTKSGRGSQTGTSNGGRAILGLSASQAGRVARRRPSRGGQITGAEVVHTLSVVLQRSAIVRRLSQASGLLDPLIALQERAAGLRELSAAVAAWLPIRWQATPPNAPVQRHSAQLRRELVRIQPALRRIRTLAEKSMNPGERFAFDDPHAWHNIGKRPQL